MTRCHACDEIHASTPHATVTGEECRGPVAVDGPVGNYSGAEAVLVQGVYEDMLSRLRPTFPPPAERLAATHFDIAPVRAEPFQIAPVPGMPPGAAIVVGADGPELVIVNIGEIDPATVTVANGTAPATLVPDPPKTPGSNPGDE